MPIDIHNRIMQFSPVGPGTAEGSVGGLVMYVMIALGVSFLCSILEAVLLSVSLSHIELQIQQGKRGGVLMQKHKENIERPISAILTLNTIAHTVGAAGAGAEAAAIFGSQFIGVISAVLTLLILIFSEIIPKTLGAVYWKQLSSFVGYTIQVLVFVLYPVVWIFELMTSLLRPDDLPPNMTRSDLEVLAKVSVREGILLEQENRIIRNLLHLESVNVGNIMTPRTVVMSLQKNMTVKEALQKSPALPYSRIPIFTENMDDASSYVLRNQIFEKVAAGEEDVTLISMARDLHSVPETVSVAMVLNEFIAKKEHILLVFDEHGGTAGIISFEDAIESLLGIEITDESDIVADLRQLAQERYKKLSANRL